MRPTQFVIYAAVSMLIVLGGCNGGSTSSVTAPGPTQVDLTVTPNPAPAGSPVSFTVNAVSDHLALKSAAIDFTNDGTWDEERVLDRSSVTEAFAHTYNMPGTYTARVEVKDANDAPVSTTVPVFVAFATAVDVSYKMFGISAKGGYCGAVGLPAAPCANCGLLLGSFTSDGISRPLGTYPEGTEIQVSQNFAQEPYVGGHTTYSCRFLMVLVAKTTLGGVHEFAAGQCSTTSDSGGRLTCNIDVRSTVTAGL